MKKLLSVEDFIDFRNLIIQEPGGQEPCLVLCAGTGGQASGSNEVSAENDDIQHGVFTYYLIEGLKGKADMDKDGLITVDEAYRYVSYQVPRATGQEQHPVKKGTVEGRLILGVTE